MSEANAGVCGVLVPVVASQVGVLHAQLAQLVHVHVHVAVRSAVALSPSVSVSVSVSVAVIRWRRR